MHLITDHQISQLVDDGSKLDRYLFGRHVPLEPQEIYSAKKLIERDILGRKSKIDDFTQPGKLTIDQRILHLNNHHLN